MSDLEQRETPRNSYRAARRDAPVGLNQRTDAMSKLPASQRARGRDRTAPKSPDHGLIPDATHRGMYRIRLPGGGLSDLMSLTWAKDALARPVTSRRRSS
jgi:hypothetical protein